MYMFELVSRLTKVHRGPRGKLLLQVVMRHTKERNLTRMQKARKHAKRIPIMPRPGNLNPGQTNDTYAMTRDNIYCDNNFETGTLIDKRWDNI